MQPRKEELLKSSLSEGRERNVEDDRIENDMVLTTELSKIALSEECEVKERHRNRVQRRAHRDADVYTQDE